MQRLARTLNALMIFVLVGILLSAYYQQFTKQGEPCPLCILQRLGMITVAFGLFLNLWYGIRRSHYTLSLVGALVGGSSSLRQICLHICPNSPTFGIPVWGYSLYVWAFFTFIASLFAIGILLSIHRDETKSLRINWFESLAILVVGLITLSNLVSTYLECGFTSCKG
ncbi:MAG: disulfide bond formation protein B [Rhabdochlamydiaceae bacterium]|nr:disulfide bond formation protein B [Candidatus Amphrikana amoebophyrae]